MLDGVGQVLLLRDIRPTLAARLPHATGRCSDFVAVHQPGQGRAGHARRLRRASSPRSGASSRSDTASLRRRRPASPRRATSTPLREVRKAYARVRDARARRGRWRGAPTYDAGAADEDGRPRGPPHGRRPRPRRSRGAAPAGAARRRSTELAATLRRRRRRPRGHAPDRARGRLPRLPGRARAPRRARLRRADRRRDPALQDAPEHPAPLAAPVPLHPGRRVPGRQHRPDRAHRAARPHAGPARQRHGRRRRRPVDLPLPGRQLRRLRRVRPRASHARRPTTRTATPPGPPPRLRIEQNFRSVGPRADRRQPADRPQPDPLRARQAPPHASATTATRSSSSSAPGRRTRRSPSSTPSATRLGEDTRAGRTSPSCTASTSTARRSSPACATRTSRTPWSVGCRCSRRPEIRDLEQALRAIADPEDDVALDPDDDRRPVAARRARDPARRPAWRGSTGATCSRRCGDRATRARSREIDQKAPMSRPRRHRDRRWSPPTPATRAKLRRLLGRPRRAPGRAPGATGPFTILERFLELERPGARPDRRRHDRRPSRPSPTSPASCASRPTGRPSIPRARSAGSSTTSTPTRTPAASCRPASS